MVAAAAAVAAVAVEEDVTRLHPNARIVEMSFALHNQARFT